METNNEWFDARKKLPQNRLKYKKLLIIMDNNSISYELGQYKNGSWVINNVAVKPLESKVVAWQELPSLYLK